MKLSWPKSKRSPREPQDGETLPSSTRIAALAEPLLVDADLLSDVGCVRTNNEDTGRIARDPHAGTAGARTLVVVADGMGGHNAGEVASAMAAETLENAFAGMSTDPAKRLKNAVVEANHRIFTEARDNAERNGMGTTCSALLLQDGNAYAAHVGDSRIYLLRNGGIYQVTEDHSQVMEMVKAGLLTMQEARHHPDKNVITRALGRQPQVEVALWPQPMRVAVGDGFLLCSDGVCEVLEDDELNSIASAHNAADACEELIRVARSRNATDNITVAVIKLLPLLSKSVVAGATSASNESISASRPTRRVEMES